MHNLIFKTPSGNIHTLAPNPFNPPANTAPPPHPHPSAFATSVGSRTLHLWSAVAIAAVFEFLGAMLLGGNVTRTIAGSIANVRTFAATPAVFMFGA